MYLNLILFVFVFIYFLQNYGPKTNFKKMKLSHGTFKGFPEYSQFVQEQFERVTLLKDFQTIEQCSLEYNPDKGASIDPHIDDCWIWGERVVTVNCLSDSVLTLVRSVKMFYYYQSCLTNQQKYNDILFNELSDILVIQNVTIFL